LIFYYAGRANSAAKFWQIYQMIRGSWQARKLRLK
jgi:hypothetical protein